MYIRRTEKELKQSIDELREFINKDKVKKLLIEDPDNRYLGCKVEEDSDTLENVGYIDIKNKTFIPYSKEKVYELLDKDFEPKLFSEQRLLDADRSKYNIALPYYQSVILFKVGNNYFEHYPDFDGHNLIKCVEKLYRYPEKLIHISNTYYSKTNSEGYSYVINICKNHDWDRFSDDSITNIEMDLFEVKDKETYSISKMELDDLIEAFEITDKDAINFIKECFSNRGVITNIRNLIELNRDGDGYRFRYKLSAKALNNLYKKLNNLKNSLKCEKIRKPEQQFTLMEEC